MSVNAIGAGQQNQAKSTIPTVEKEKKKPGDASELSKLNAEIKQTESDMKETMKEAQEAAGESISGSSEKVQMLQNKVQMQMQEILMKQLKIKEIESPSKSAKSQESVDTVARPRVDQYAAGEDASSKHDNVYRLKEKDGTRTIVFNRPQD